MKKIILFLLTLCIAYETNSMEIQNESNIQANQNLSADLSLVVSGSTMRQKISDYFEKHPELKCLEHLINSSNLESIYQHIKSERIDILYNYVSLLNYSRK